MYTLTADKTTAALAWANRGVTRSQILYKLEIYRFFHDDVSN